MRLDHDLGMSASPFFAISDGRCAGRVPSAHPGAREEERMTAAIEIARERSMIGIDVSKDHPDIRCLPDDRKGRARAAKMSRERNAVVGFEAAGGGERPLRAALARKEISARQLPPA